MRRATPCTARTHCSQLFQSTLSMRRATDDDPGQRHGYRISIHALHEESDMLRESEAYGPSSFQSTLSMRRATSRRGHGVASRIFQSTLSMRRATATVRKINRDVNISIHALHEESDRRLLRLAQSAHPFQSTLSMRRATRRVRTSFPVMLFQSTLSMRRATRGCR